MVVIGSLWAVAALSPFTAASWLKSQGLTFGTHAALALPSSALPLHLLRTPAFAPSDALGRYSLVQRIDLKKYFGFDANELQDKDSFKISLDNTMYSVTRKSVEKLPGGFRWIGSLDSKDQQNFDITYLKGYAGATITTAKATYTIEYEHGRHVLKKVDPTL